MRPRPISKTLIALFCSLAAAQSGCSFFSGEKKEKPTPLEFTLESPYPGVHTLAVAPAINLSGSRDFDVLTVSDALFEQLQEVRDLNVLPLNKTLIAMRRLGVREINDPHTAQKIAEALGADGLVIPAITAYDPYNPPTVGMVLQLYTPHADPLRNDLAPGRLSAFLPRFPPLQPPAAPPSSPTQAPPARLSPSPRSPPSSTPTTRPSSRNFSSSPPDARKMIPLSKAANSSSIPTPTCGLSAMPWSAD